MGQVFSYPVLAPEEEYMLAERFRKHGDVEAARTLVTSHLRLVVKIAAGYRNYGFPFGDLISEGAIGLMHAVRKFEPERGFRLSTYAMWWIKARIQEFILGSWSMVTAGSVAARKKLFWNLKKVRAKLGLYEGNDIPDALAGDIGRSFGLTAETVHDVSRWMAVRDTSLNEPATIEGTAERIDTLADDRPNQEERFAAAEEQALVRTEVSKALDGLDARERRIVECRILADEPMTLEQIGADFGVSRERVRQLEARALGKLRRTLAASDAVSQISDTAA